MTENLLGIEVDPMGEECLRCEQCGRLVPARPTAWRLHHELTCAMYQQADEILSRARGWVREADNLRRWTREGSP